MIEICFYPAKGGDAFLISFGANKDINIVIDMGYIETYKKHVKKDFIKLNSQNKKLDLIVVTHIDLDHINGVIEFIKDNQDSENIIPVGEVWHNSYRHLQIDKQEGVNLNSEEISVLQGLINQNRQVDKPNGISDIGAKEGTGLASLLYRYNYNWNTSFQGQTIVELNKKKLSEVSIITLSPNKEKLEILEKEWRKKLNSIIYNFTYTNDTIFDDAFELYMQTKVYPQIGNRNISAQIGLNKLTIEKIKSLANIESGIDNSLTNGSSIALILEYKKYKLLLLADAHEEIVYNNLLKLKEDGYHLDFDLVKVSHHGSINNITNRLIEIIESPKYLISTNGEKHNHPSTETIAKIILKETLYKKYIYVNYEVRALEPFKDPKFQELYNYEIVVCNKINI